MGCTLKKVTGQNDKKVTGQDDKTVTGQAAYCESGPSAICMLGHTAEKEAGQAISYVDWPGIARTLFVPMRQVWLTRSEHKM